MAKESTEARMDTPPAESSAQADSATKLTKSTSNLNDVVYSGRPKTEEPHVKRTSKKKSEKIEYIVRVDLEELKINDDEFDDLQSLFILFDLDKDGILNFKEYEKLLKCLGYRLNESQAKMLASVVSVDKTNYSVSFNEFLTLMSHQQESEPDHETLVDVFESFDREGLGKISEKCFKDLLKSKEDISEEEINEMLEEYYRLAKLKGISTEKPDPPSDSSSDEDDDDDDDEKSQKSAPAPPAPVPPQPQAPPPQVRNVKSPSQSIKSPPSGKRRTPTSVMSPTKSQKSLPPEEEKWIDYREFASMLQQ